MDSLRFSDDPPDPGDPQIFRPGSEPARPQPDAVAGDGTRTPTRAGLTGDHVRALEALLVRPDGEVDPAGDEVPLAAKKAVPPTSDAPPRLSRRETPPAEGPRLARDRAILIRLARLRVLSLSQLSTLVFAGRDRSRLSRRVTALEDDGWLQRWEHPRERGGRYRFVVPTAKGLAWALHRLEDVAPGFAHERLLATMLGTDRAAPLALPAGRIPASLPHLLEVNAALVALLADPALRVTWASSWPRPFPVGSVEGLRLPQSDGVIVQVPDDAPSRLVLLEHDRATESLRSFSHTKVDRYRALASRPALLEKLTGFRTFSTVVTVAGPDDAETDRRIASITKLVRSRFAGELLQVVSLRDLLARPEIVDDL